MTPQAPRLFSSPRVRLLALVFGFFFALNAAFAAKVKFNISAQPAPAALKLFIKQSGVQVVFSNDKLAMVQANEVIGEMEPVDALNKLLAGTGYEAIQSDAKNFIVKKSEVQSTTGSVKGSLTGEGGKGLPDVLVSIRETAQSTETDRYGVFDFPNVAAGTYVLVASAPGYQTMHIADVQVKAGRDLTIGKEEMRKAQEGPLALEPFVVHADTVEQLEKFIVTETRPKPFSDRNVDLPRTINDVQPYYIFDSQKIEESGTNNVEDFLKQRLTMNTTAQTSSEVTHYNTTVTSGFTGLTGTDISSINLNGLGADRTLVLVNGLPMAGVTVFTGGAATPRQPDVNGIPLAAIDRIEVLPSSAGAIYGAQAVGGVINIILKKAYNGGDITATYAGTWDGHGPTRTIAATFGHSFEGGKTQLFVTAQYSDQKPMFVQDRVELLNRGYARFQATDPSFISYDPTSPFGIPIGSTPNIMGVDSSFNPINLTLKSTGASLGSPIATLPVGYNGDTSRIISGKFNLTPGEDNEAPNGLLVPLGNYPRRKSIMATLTRQMTDKLQLHLDFSRSENHSFSVYNPINTVGYQVPASAPVNPFNQTVYVTFPVNLNASDTSDTNTTAIALGGTLKLPFDWVTHLDYQWSESSFASTRTGILNNPFNYSAPTFYASDPRYTYLGVPDTNPTPLWSGAVNPFTDTLANSINWAPFLANVYNSGKTTTNDLIFAASGPLFHLPWGDPRLSIRLEHNKTGQPPGASSDFVPVTTPYLGLPYANWLHSSSFGQTQTTDSANVELDLPIFKSKWPLLRSLDAQINLGTETSTVSTGTPGTITYPVYPYSAYPNGAILLLGPNTLGTTRQPLASYTNQAGVLVPASTAQPFRSKAVNSHTSITGPALSYKPTDDIIIRGSIGTGYVPPTYAQLLPTNYLQTPTTTRITDPKLGTAYNVTVYNLGGNPKLMPQTSKSWNLGIIWEPQCQLLKGLRADAEFVETKQQNLILNPGAQTLVNFERNFPGLVVRDPTSGLVTTVYSQYVNVAEAKQDAWTFSLDYSWRTSIGSFELTGAETIQEHLQQQLVVGTNFLEFVGFPNSGGVAKTKATATLRWALHNWVAAWTVVNFGHYNQFGAPGDPGAYASQLEHGQPYTLFTNYTDAQGGNIIPSQTYHNLYVSYTFPKNTFDQDSHWGRLSSSFLNGMKVSLGINNVFNTMPPFDAFYQPFYTSPYGDVQLRNYTLRFQKSF